MAKDPEMNQHRRRRNFVADEVRDRFRGIHVRDGRTRRIGPDRWEFTYRMFICRGRAANAYDATAKGWTAFMREQGVAGDARRVNVPAQFAFTA